MWMAPDFGIAPDFDELDEMFAQAQLEGLTIVTRDPRIPRYGVATLPA
jgi:hypothetical protein